MTGNKSMDWDTGDESRLVTINNYTSHKLYLHCSGPSRTPNSPLTILIPGFGCNTSSWAAIIRQLSTFTRVLSYERSGYAPSSTSTLPSSAVNIASELNSLLTTTGIEGQFILLAHSWGGIIALEFLSLPSRAKDVVGMVFVDANQPRTLDVLDWRVLFNSHLLEGVDYDAVCLSHHHLTASEWNDYVISKNMESHKKQVEREIEQYPRSFDTIKTKFPGPKLALIPGSENAVVCVVKGDNLADFSKLLEAGLARGNGVGKEEEVERYRARLGPEWRDKDRDIQREFLRLGKKGCFVEVPGAGHNLQLTAPEKVVDGVRWVLTQLVHDREMACEGDGV